MNITRIRPTRHTHTIALLEVSATTYAEIRDALMAAGYDHVLADPLTEDEFIDMSGIGLKLKVPE